MAQVKNPILPHRKQLIVHGGGDKIREANDVWIGLRDSSRPTPQYEEARFIFTSPEKAQGGSNEQRLYDVRCSYNMITGKMEINQVGKALYAPGLPQDMRNDAVYEDGYKPIERDRVESLFMKFVDAFERWEVQSGHGWTREEHEKWVTMEAILALLDDTARTLQTSVDILASAENAQEKGDIEAMEYTGEMTKELVWSYQNISRRLEYITSWTTLSPVQQEVYDANMGKIKEAITKLLNLPLAA